MSPFWESRNKSIAILDEEALLAIHAYTALNPVAVRIASAVSELNFRVAELAKSFGRRREFPKVLATSATA